MDSNTTSLTLSDDPLEHPALDFNFLRQEGIQYIQKLAGNTWTDHNTHDPGITILDLLCYALTDLSYRINYNIRDLIAEKDGDPYKSLYSPAAILTSNPVTIIDIRKIVVDVEGVKNAWVEKQTQPKPDIFYNPQDKTLNLSSQDATAEIIPVNGLYRVLIEKKESAPQDARQLEIDVTSRLHECRTLCEDYSEIKILGLQLITISGSIEVGQVADINKLAAGILFRAASFISPQVRFYTLNELLNKGKRIDEIFDGPALKHGFIDDDELMKFDRKTELHTSDLIREMMDAPGVLAVNNIELITDSGLRQNWRLVLDADKTPQLDRVNSLANLKFIKNELRLSLDNEKVEKYFLELRDAHTYLPLDRNERDIIPEVRKFRNIGSYYSIQNHFPQAYGISDTGLPDAAPSKRKAQAKQLKGYLMFFEQILADYFEQIAHAKDLFSFYSEQMSTYFHQSLKEVVPGAGGILRNVEKQEGNLVGFTENNEEDTERKNRFLNHLLARFSESFADYSLWLYDQEIKEAPDEDPATSRSMVTPGTLVKYKLNFLKNYPSISNDRGKAFNCKRKSWDTDNVSGLEKRIAAKLGITNFKRRSLAGNNKEGFHLLEHILLRPVQEDLSGFTEYLLPRSITLFEDAGEGFIKCHSAGHGLQTGEPVEIKGSNGYDGNYTVERVLPDSFQVRANYTGPGMEETQNDQTVRLHPSWIRTEFDTKILILTKPVLKFSPAGTNTACEAPGHGLENDELIEIVGTKNYNGIYRVFNCNKEKFEINKPFVGAEERGGRWISTAQSRDPYSLQLTFVFPDRPDRTRDRFQNEGFRAFIENTIREETPVHLTVYIRWLAEAEMLKFENAFTSFLEQLSND